MQVTFAVSQSLVIDNAYLANRTRILAEGIADEVARQFKLSLISLRTVATGKTLQSVRHEELLSGGTRIFEQKVTARDVWQEIQRGRKAGRMPLEADMLEWFTTLNVPREAWFPIRRAIFLRGIQPRDVLGRALREASGRVQFLLRVYAQDLANNLVRPMRP